MPRQPGLGARLAFAAVDGELVLEGADASRRPACSRARWSRRRGWRRCSTALICGTSRSAAGVGLPVLVARRAGRLEGIEAGAEQRLAHIDVAEAGDDALVHQEGLEVGLLAAARGGRDRPASGRRRAARRRGRAKKASLRELRLRDQRHVAEAARIVVGDDGAARHREHEVVVLGVVRRARRCSRRAEIPLPLVGRG